MGGVKMSVQHKNIALCWIVVLTICCENQSNQHTSSSWWWWYIINVAVEIIMSINGCANC